ncbi:putative DUF1272 family protein [Octadecabacter antarcticus 307]|uniref:Putative DUF1272 family protein n=1 Tax=Octadecabacter antarcticus 307 TaxID=391626 RepID=M9RDY0_9RHOB|nr:DUF1272 domain-containing protein [Octadecabacter antarcticus]AGI68000.1 putative DUF1272 family protein [Octadecabacter antarcticus 307]
MLDLRPNCEWCDTDLAADATNARICSYECTYCAKCVESVLHNVCPTCGGGFVSRPIRPQTAYHETPQLGLGHQPASTTRIHSKWTRADLDQMSMKLRNVPVTER